MRTHPAAPFVCIAVLAIISGGICRTEAAIILQLQSNHVTGWVTGNSYDLTAAGPVSGLATAPPGRTFRTADAASESAAGPFRVYARAWEAQGSVGGGGSAMAESIFEFRPVETPLAVRFFGPAATNFGEAPVTFILTNLTSASTIETWSGAADQPAFDFTRNWNVNLADTYRLRIAANAEGLEPEYHGEMSVDFGQVIPEPGTALLAAAATVGVLLQRRGGAAGPDAMR